MTLSGSKIEMRIFGASHAKSIGVEITGLEAGIAIDCDRMQKYVHQRSSVSRYTTPRREKDTVQVLSGIKGGITTGDTIRCEIVNSDVRSADYGDKLLIPRPSHADYAAFVKYGAEYDFRGGGQFSGRMTAPMTIAGGIAVQILEREGITLDSYVSGAGDKIVRSYNRTANSTESEMENYLCRIAEQGDSVGGSVECVVNGVRAGLGGPTFDGIESSIAYALFGIPAVKAVEFGDGTDFARQFGSVSADEIYADESGAVKTYTNRNGGINGGITNGMPILVRATFKPTPTVFKPLRSINIVTKEPVVFTAKGRHDSTLVTRARVVVESMTAFTLLNILKREI